MRPRVSFAAAAAATVVALVAPSARADILPDGKRSVEVSVTFTGAIDSHVVAYPTDCMGLDVALNPQLEFYQDYDVIQQGKPRSPYKFCNEKTRVWALDTSSFKKVPGEKVPAFVHSEWKLEEISRIRVPERANFFRTNAHVHATGYSMPAAGLVDEGSPLAKVEELVTFGGLPPRVQNVRLTYRYKDGASEEHTYAVGARPQPRRAGARDWMAGLVEEKPDAGASEDDAGAPEDAGAPARLDAKLFVMPSHPANLPGRSTAGAEATAPRPPARRSHRLMLVVAVAAALGAAFALRESGDRGKKG